MPAAEEDILLRKGIRPTTNRILVVRALLHASAPMSMSMLEEEISSVDKSGIFRALSLFAEHELVHVVEGGDNMTRYELCHGGDHCTIDDMHVHFYCEKCHRTFCFADVPVPKVEYPAGFAVSGANYMARGLCRDCREK